MPVCNNLLSVVCKGLFILKLLLYHILKKYVAYKCKKEHEVSLAFLQSLCLLQSMHIEARY